MFPISHAYIATKVLGRTSSLLMWGSILPDIRVITKADSPLDRLHSEPEKLLNFIKINYPDLIDLGIAVRLHCPQDKGADFYSDDIKIGYAFIKAKEIKKEAGDLIQDTGFNALVLAHNFIEAALDLKIQKFDCKIGKIYQKGIEQANYRRVAECLSDYFKIEIKSIENDLLTLADYFSLKHLSSKETFAKLFPGPTEKRYGIRIDSLKPIVHLIEKSEKIIADSFEDYYNNTILLIKNNLSDLIGS